MAASLCILTAFSLGTCLRSEQSKFISLLNFLSFLRGKCENPRAEEMKYFGRVPPAESHSRCRQCLPHAAWPAPGSSFCHICCGMSSDLWCMHSAFQEPGSLSYISASCSEIHPTSNEIKPLKSSAERQARGQGDHVFA